MRFEHLSKSFDRRFLIKFARKGLLSNFFAALVMAFFCLPAFGKNSSHAPVVQFVFVNHANIHYFALLDCLALKDFNYCSDFGAIREGLDKLSPKFCEKHAALLEEYRSIRLSRAKSYNTDFNPTVNRNGLFTPIEYFSSDPVLEEVFESNSEDEMFSILGKYFREHQVKVVKTLFQLIDLNFPQIRVEIKQFESKSKLGNNLSSEKVLNFRKKMEKFYGTSDSKPYRVAFSWMPGNFTDLTIPTGRTILMRRNLQHVGDSTEEATILHEFAHYLSAFQSFDAKRKFTDDFLKICDPRRKTVASMRILEEPLAVATGEMAYLKIFDTKTFTKRRVWYGDPWVSTFAKRIFPIVEQYMKAGRTIDSNFIVRASAECKLWLDEYIDQGVPILKNSSSYR